MGNQQPVNQAVEPVRLNAQPILRIKTILLGDPGTGKSSYFLKVKDNRFVEDRPPSIGVDFVSLDFPTFGATISLWDPEGLTKYRSPGRAFYLRLGIAILCFDVTSRESFEHLDDFLCQTRKEAINELELLFVGNKSDKAGREVSREEAERFALDRGGFYMDTSMKQVDGFELRKKLEEILEKMQLRGFEHYGVLPVAR